MTVVDRDALPATPRSRPGVPQARHAHILLARGQRAYETLFPGIDAELAAAGAPRIDWTADTRLYFFGGWKPRFASGIASRLCSRDLLEWIVRRRVLALPGVTLLPGAEATALLPGGARRPTGVAGVRLTPRPAPGGRPPGAPAAPFDLGADFVLDAAGRDSRAPEWLGALGYAAPEEETVTSFLGYASRTYARPAGAGKDWALLLLAATPPQGTRGGVIIPVEGDRWCVTLAGAARDYPPTDEAGFLEFARSLPSPVLYDALRAATPLSPVSGYRRTGNRRRRFDRLSRWPAGFAVTGDAVCAFNPVYGQGMTVAALDALVLAAALRRAGRPARSRAPVPGLRFQRALARTGRLPWALSTSEDFRYPTTEGGRPGPAMGLLHRYLDGVLLASTDRPAAHLAFVSVTHLLAPPVALLRPAVALPALAALRRAPRRRPVPA